MYQLQAALSFTIEDLINPDHKKKLFLCLILYLLYNKFCQGFEP